MAKRMSKKNPLLSKSAERRKGKTSKGKPVTGTVAVCQVTVDPAASVSLVRHETISNLVSLHVPVGPDGLDRPRRDKIETIGLNARKLGRFRPKLELEGKVPDGTKIEFSPRRARPPRRREGKPPRNSHRGGSIFGNEDRDLFLDRSFPWRTTGLIRVAGGRCSGTTIGRRLVLTASHCINWSASGNSAGWVTFTPGYFDGSEPWGEINATQVISWQQNPLFMTDRQTAFDYVVLVMEDPIGDTVGYPGYRTYDDDWNDGVFWQYVGYPGELAAGERPAFQGSCVVSSAQSFSMSGQSGLAMGHFNEFTPGQSGGAAWGWWGSEPWPRVVGVGSIIGDTVVQPFPGTTRNDNHFGGGRGLSALISWARSNFP